MALGLNVRGADSFTFKLPKSDVLPRWRPRSPLMPPSRASTVHGGGNRRIGREARGQGTRSGGPDCVLRSSIRLALSLGASGALRHPSLRNFSTIGGELAHDLLVEPNIHFG